MTRKDTFTIATPIDLITAIRFYVSTLKLHHAIINPYLVGVHSLRAGGGISLKLHGESDTTIMKMGRWSNLTFLMYYNDQIGNISKWLAQEMSRPTTFLYTTLCFNRGSV